MISPTWRWWNSIRHLSLWSGAIVNMEYKDLWPYVQEELRVVYNKIATSGNQEGGS